MESLRELEGTRGEYISDKDQHPLRLWLLTMMMEHMRSYSLLLSLGTTQPRFSWTTRFVKVTGIRRRTGISKVVADKCWACQLSEIFAFFFPNVLKPVVPSPIRKYYNCLIEIDLTNSFLIWLPTFRGHSRQQTTARHAGIHRWRFHNDGSSEWQACDFSYCRIYKKKWY